MYAYIRINIHIYILTYDYIHTYIHIHVLMCTYIYIYIGTMPCITIEEPTQRDSEGALLLDFQKVHIDRVSKRKFTINNHGVMPATCLFNMAGAEDFQFSSRNSSLTLEPGQKEELVVSFAPKTVAGINQVVTATVKVSVLHNQFDQYQLKLKGIAYECDAMIDTDFDQGMRSQQTSTERGLQEGTVTFPQINLAESPGSIGTSSYTVLLRSRSEHFLKFDFAAAEGRFKKKKNYLYEFLCIYLFI
jgi:hypothetical protein